MDVRVRSRVRNEFFHTDEDVHATGVLKRALLPLTFDEVASHFKGARRTDVEASLETLVQMGNVKAWKPIRLLAAAVLLQFSRV